MLLSINTQHHTVYAFKHACYTTAELVSVEKTTMHMILPNGLTLTTRSGDKITLGSFLYRDDCHALLKKLMGIGAQLSSVLQQDGNSSASITTANASATAVSSVDDGDSVQLQPDAVTNAAQYDLMLDTELQCSVTHAID
eukprot:14989-Heterococcus_DN1.PRE.4